MSAGVAEGVSAATRSPDNPAHLGDMLELPFSPRLARLWISPTINWPSLRRPAPTAPAGEDRRHPVLEEEAGFSVAGRRRLVGGPWRREMEPDVEEEKIVEVPGAWHLGRFQAEPTGKKVEVEVAAPSDPSDRSMNV